MGRRGLRSLAIIEGITAEKKKPLERIVWVRAVNLEILFCAVAMSHNMRVVYTYFEKAENIQEWNSRVRN